MHVHVHCIFMYTSECMPACKYMYMYIVYAVYACTCVCTINTLYFTVGAGLGGDGSGTVAVLEGETATLVCGTDLTGNPFPNITWRDNNDRSACTLHYNTYMYLHIVYIVHVQYIPVRVHVCSAHILCL